jgi:hypothetical protein
MFAVATDLSSVLYGVLTVQVMPEAMQLGVEAIGEQGCVKEAGEKNDEKEKGKG